MNIYVLNTALEKLDVIDTYTSVIWDIRYHDYDQFELYLPATSKNIELLRIRRYLVRDKDIIDGNMYNVMIILNLQIHTDIENGNYLIVSGKSLKSIIARRIVWNQTNLSGTVESCMRRLITENVITPGIAARQIKNVVLGDFKGYTETTTQQITGDNLGDSIVNICTTYGYGWRVYINSSKEFVVDFYKGVDRSDNQSANPHVTFSTEYDTLLTSDYMYDTTEFKNVALIAGEGEGTARRTATFGVASGLNRFEQYVDAREISSNNGEINESEYATQLRDKGIESLEATNSMESFEGEIEPNSNYIYGIDYNLGDIVNFKNEYGIASTPRITGIIESDSEQGESIIPTFSTTTA